MDAVIGQRWGTCLVIMRLRVLIPPEAGHGVYAYLFFTKCPKSGPSRRGISMNDVTSWAA